MNRINYLDGHRGIAILLVIFFHAYSRWSEILPYGDKFSTFPLFEYGFLGVQLFFILSGFVILMTLDKCNTIQGFIYQRWLRLFPAMLACSVIIYISSGFFFERPLGEPLAKNLLPGLIFVEPYVLTKLTGINFQSLEGPFWSLYVEFKFYVIAALIYFWIGSKNLVIALFLCSIVCFFLAKIAPNSDNIFLINLDSVMVLLSGKHFGWFAAGAAFYLFTKSGNKAWYLFGLFICVISSAMLAYQSKSIATFIAIIVLISVFVLSLTSVKLQHILSHKFLLYLGFISYPLYLLHENMMISIILKFSAVIPANLSFLLPIFAIIFISFIAYLVAKYIEKSIKKTLLYFLI